MRLLHVESLQFVEIHDLNQAPKYVVASHRWLERETSFREFRERSHVDGAGFKKVEAFADYVRKKVPGVKYVWVDSCCINRESAAELSEAINLMFDWYRKAELCVTYLADVESIGDLEISEWFERGWTLQELLAPRTVVFVNKIWRVVGNKGASYHAYSGTDCGPGLEGVITRVTGIEEQVLYDYSTSLAMTVDDKMKWMEGRKTTKGEDMAYALYGIFDVRLGQNYGEGRERAQDKLVSEIKRKEAERARRHQQAAIFSAAAEGNIQVVRECLRQASDLVSTHNAHSRTPLHLAARAGQLEMVEYLIRNGAVVNADDEQGRVPLHDAVEGGCEAVVRTLLLKGADASARDAKGISPRDMCDPQSLMIWFLHHGADLTTKDGENFTALCLFAHRGDTEATRKLLDMGADIEGVGRTLYTPLFEAVLQQEEEVVALLLSYGANVHVRSVNNYTPLIKAALHGYTHIGEMLLDSGADVNAQNNLRFSALHDSCAHGRLDMASILLEKGADFGLLNGNGYAPLHEATKNNHIDIVRKLLDFGDDANRQLIRTRPSKGMAQRSSALHEAASRNYRRLVELLIQRGAAIEARDSKMCTPLFCAVQNGCKRSMEFLLEAGADSTASDDNSRLPIHVASQGGEKELVQLLIDHAMSSNSFTTDTRDAAGCTPLMLAAANGHLDIVNLLIDVGKADTNAKSNDGRTALIEACDHDHLDVVQALSDHGADKTISTKYGKSAGDVAADKGHERIFQLLDSHSDPCPNYAWMGLARWLFG